MKQTCCVLNDDSKNCQNIGSFQSTRKHVSITTNFDSIVKLCGFQYKRAC